VLKDTAGDELVAAIHAALGGRQYLSRELGERPGHWQNGIESE
jgi:DNA-binding NarL/FixJ family response regulator